MVNNNILYIAIVLLCSIFTFSSSQSVFTTPGLIDQNDFGVSHLVLFEGLKLHVRTYENPNITSGYTLLFDSGLPYFSSSWGSVLLNLIPKMTDLKIKNAIFFDRYGYGYSDLSPYGIDSFDFARRLRASLNILNFQPPYVITGWSWGGINLQSYYLAYPSDVIGLLSIDGTDKEFYNDPWWIANMGSTMDTFKSYIKNNTENHDGFVLACQEGRIGPNFGYYTNSVKLPKIALKNNQDIYPDSSNKYLNAATQELGTMFQSSLKVLNAVNRLQETEEYPYKNTPFVVITAAASGQAWMARQNDMAKLSSNSKHIIDYTSSHHIPTDNPVEVVNALTDLISKIENPEPLNSSGSISFYPNRLAMSILVSLASALLVLI
ncbi:hypothetical protein CYY_003487 [Polysphondylium violaceum]|uniref:AB hydrolase-1 domain-containing protein n=1 Tax=Polysphondylium violaceum TaxID=133409 RepID=A0A8J4UUA6_9MYCE|nr:hypothetical protein CYY_003487 [Polysphondylium violaceum]